MYLCISPTKKPPYWSVCSIAGSFKLCPDLIVFLLCFLAYILYDLTLCHTVRNNQALVYQIICCLVCIVVSDIVDALCRYFRLQDIIDKFIGSLRIRCFVNIYCMF